MNTTQFPYTSTVPVAASGVPAIFAVLPSLRGKPVGRLATPYLIVVLLLGVILPASGTFLIAENLADNLGGTRYIHVPPGKGQVSAVPAGQSGHLADHSPDRLGRDAGEDEDKMPSSGPKRLRGVLNTGVDIDKTPGLIASRNGLVEYRSEESPSLEPVLAGPISRDSLPQELLSRPPPGN